MLSSCGMPRFAKDGIFVDDVDEYFNPQQEINVWVYSNFYPYKHLDHGVRMNSWYESDKLVLKTIGFKSQNNKALFSAKPRSGPPYHLIAIKHSKNNVDLQGYEKVVVDSSLYYQQDYKVDNLDIRHVYIPYGLKMGLSLVYYTSTEHHYTCLYCKLDYLARVNAYELQHKNDNAMGWQIFDCRDDKLVETVIPLNADLIRNNKRTFLKISAQYTVETGTQYFQPLNKTSKTELRLKLCPNRYIIELSDAKYRLLQSDTLVVD